MARLGCEVDGTTKGVENAPILVLATRCAEPLVEALRVAPAQIAHPLDSEVEEILSQTRPDAGNSLEFCKYGPADIRATRSLLLSLQWHSFESVA